VDLIFIDLLLLCVLDFKDTINMLQCTVWTVLDLHLTRERARLCARD